MSRRERLILAAILGVALGLRLWLLIDKHAGVLFDHPVLDEQRYVDAARALAHGLPAEQRPFWQPPGIEYVLAAIFKLAGPGLLVPRLIQALVSTAACLLLFAIGRRLVSTRVGLAAAAILAVHGVVVFESYELLPPTWILAFDLLALHLLLIARERRTWPWALATGLALGVSAVFSPTILPFALVAAALLRRPLLIAVLAAGVLLPIAPVTARNYQHGGELVLVSTNGGLNFYIGNNPRYAETFALRPGRRWEELTDEPRRHGVAAPGAASTYFFRKGLRFWTGHPLEAAGLLARKAYLFVHAAELPRDTDIYAERAGAPILAALVWPGPVRFPDVIVIPLALVGIALTWRRRRRLAPALGLLAVQAAVLAAFFVSARHRVPALAVFALFAAAGGAELIRRWREDRGLRRAWPLVAVAVLAIAVSLPVREAELSYAAELDFYRGLVYRDHGDIDRSVAALQRSAAGAPDDPRAWFELGNTLAGAGRGPEAVAAWRRAAAADPWDSRPRRRASQVLARTGDVDGAIAMLQANIDAGLREPAHYAPDYVNLAFLHATHGQAGRAADELRAAVHADPAYCRDHLDGLTRAALGDPSIADPAFWAALAELDDRLGLRDVAAEARLRASPPPPQPAPPTERPPSDAP